MTEPQIPRWGMFILAVAFTAAMFLLVSFVAPFFGQIAPGVPPLSASFSSTTGIVASPTQNQGEGALTTVINEIETVANENDVVTMPPAGAGELIFITNHGENRVQIFPFSGNNTGHGLNISTHLEENNTLIYASHDATNWDLVGSTQRFHAQMEDTDNTDAFVVTAQNADGVGAFYHTNGIVSGDVLGWTFDPGSAGNPHTISSIADAGGGDITVTTSDAHDLAVGALITHDGTSDAAYNGPFLVLTVPTTTTYTVTATFTATDTGTMDEGATLSPDTGYGGDYVLNWWVTATSVANNRTFDFHVHVDTVRIATMDAEQRFGTGSEEQSLSGGGMLHVEDGEKVVFMIADKDASSDITLIKFTLTLRKV